MSPFHSRIVGMKRLLLIDGHSMAYRAFYAGHGRAGLRADRRRRRALRDERGLEARAAGLDEGRAGLGQLVHVAVAVEVCRVAEGGHGVGQRHELVLLVARLGRRLAQRGHALEQLGRAGHARVARQQRLLGRGRAGAGAERHNDEGGKAEHSRVELFHRTGQDFSSTWRTGHVRSRVP